MLPAQLATSICHFIFFANKKKIKTKPQFSNIKGIQTTIRNNGRIRHCSKNRTSYTTAEERDRSVFISKKSFDSRNCLIQADSNTHEIHENDKEYLNLTAGRVNNVYEQCLTMENKAILLTLFALLFLLIKTETLKNRKLMLYSVFYYFG